MEIEKKFLVSKIPEKIEQYDKWEIEQCYLCTQPTIRIRKKNDDYILTYKNRIPHDSEQKLCVADEVEVPLTQEAFEHLKKKADGKCICKTRYRIPYETYTIELDVFHKDYEGFVLAEVEFSSIEESEKFVAPAWFYRDVSGDYHYSNSHLSQI